MLRSMCEGIRPTLPSSPLVRLGEWLGDLCIGSLNFEYLS